jgi:hypothetical protein
MAHRNAVGPNLNGPANTKGKPSFASRVRNFAKRDEEAPASDSIHPSLLRAIKGKGLTIANKIKHNLTLRANHTLSAFSDVRISLKTNENRKMDDALILKAITCSQIPIPLDAIREIAWIDHSTVDIFAHERKFGLQIAEILIANRKEIATSLNEKIKITNVAKFRYSTINVHGFPRSMTDEMIKKIVFIDMDFPTNVMAPIIRRPFGKTNDGIRLIYFTPPAMCGLLRADSQQSFNFEKSTIRWSYRRPPNDFKIT